MAGLSRPEDGVLSHAWCWASRFSPLQNPASYSLEQVMQQVKDMKNTSHAGE